MANVLLATDNGRLRLSATNLEIVITCWIGAKVKEEGAITIPARTLTDLVNVLPQDQVDLTLNETTQAVHVSCLRTQANIKGIDAQEFPLVPEPDVENQIRLEADVFKQMINQVSFAAATDDARPTLTGVSTIFEGSQILMAATDGFRLSLRSAHIPGYVEDIEIVQSDRGGLITYHGPGQLIVYTLLDIRRRKLGLKALVETLEQSVINMLMAHEIEAKRKDDAPGVYVDGRKLASLGLRMINGRTYHGLSLNVDMDMAPFERIHPCGFEGLEMTDLARLGWSEDVSSIGRLLAGEISTLLGYTRVQDKEATWKSST